MPTLIVWGDNDGVIPVSHGHDAHERIETSQLVILEGVGHFPHVESPEVFTDTLLDFLGATAPGPMTDEALHEILRSSA